MNIVTESQGILIATGCFLEHIREWYLSIHDEKNLVSQVLEGESSQNKGIQTSNQVQDSWSTGQYTFGQHLDCFRNCLVVWGWGGGGGGKVNY